MAIFNIGEKILCFHGPLLYEAKCMNIEEKGSEIKYLVHYKGWKKKWDEWITDSRMLKFNEEGLKKQKELQELYKENRKKNNKNKILGEKKRSNQGSIDPSRRLGSASETSNKSVCESDDGKGSKITTEDENLEVRTDAGTSVMSDDIDEQVSLTTKTRTRKRKNSNAGSVTTRNEPIEDVHEDTPVSGVVSVSNKSTNSSKSKRSRLVPLDESIVDLEAYVTGVNVPTLKFIFHEKLRLWLADDWDLITRQSRLSKLPSRMTVDDLLNRYAKYCGELKIDDGENEFEFHKNHEMRLELIEGFRKYFNMSLGSLLLYKFERHQYFDIISKNSNKADMSSIYGSIFILRLLVNMQKLISYTRTDPKSVDCLTELIQHFVDFLETNSEELFQLEDYITATGDYIRRAMC